jgi:peptidoglycan hydrolase-like protein with peptidoglycan-binding domain
MALRSEQFRGDQRLEAAAVSDPAHIKLGDRGPFVTKIQNALNVLDKAGIDEDGVYGPATGRAVLVYKTARGIINRAYQQKADDIVGKMTVAALDEELLRLPRPAVVPVVIIGKPGISPFPRRLSLAVSDAGPDDKPNPLKLTAVVRGNPYKSANAPPFPGVPPSIPSRKTYQVDVTIQPPLTAGQAVDIEIINGSAANGTATVSPTKLGTCGKVVVTGERQTTPGNAGQLRIQAKLNGQVLATSEGFSVCAHPSAVPITSSKRLVDPSHIGIAVRVQVESDSGKVEDLDEAVMNELVEEVQRDSPPFSATGTTVGSPFYQKIGAGAGTDEHGYRPFPGKEGKHVNEQVHVFKCARCGAKHIPIASSGFEIVGHVFTQDRGKTWKLEVTRKATKTGVIAEPEQGENKRPISANAGIGEAKSDPPEVIKPPTP